MLAFARVAGETAPLLFTAFGNTVSGICATISPRQPCRCRFTCTRIRLMTTGIGRRGRERWYLIVLIVTAVAAVRFAVRRGTFGAA